jgi:DNA-binding CsgD family transcriptional regulator
MTQNNYILIASDIPEALTSIIEKLNGLDGNICVTATRVLDCVSLIKSLQPKMIIIYFRDNQNSINYLLDYNNNLKSVIVYLTRKFENKKIDLLDKSTVFVLSYENAIKTNVLYRNITSIIRLMEKATAQALSTSKTSLTINQNNNLARYTLELDQKVTILNRIKERIKYLARHVDISTRSELLSLIQSVKLTTGDKNHWEDFKVYFENVNPNFLKNLSNIYPQLTGKDLKYCCYIKMNMSNKDICHLLGINQESVRTHRYRLKRKMTLSKSQNLLHFLQSFAV